MTTPRSSTTPRRRPTRVRALARWVIHRTGGVDNGRVSAFVVVISLALFAVAGLVLDGGLALAAKIQALDAAQAAARAGAQQLDLTLYRTTNVVQLDPAKAVAAARGWLTAAGINGEASATPTTVTVTVHRTRNTQLLTIVGITSLSVSATASATPVHGVTGPNA